MNKIEIARGGTLHKSLKRGGVALLLLIALFIPFYYPSFRVYQFATVLLFICVLAGLNVLIGFCGQISLGHGFFFAVGAYLSGILVVDYDVHYLLTIPLAAAVAFVLGYAFGVPALRLQGLYLGLVTLSLALIVPPIVRRAEGITGGSGGLRIPSPEPPEWTGLATDQWIYFVSLVITVILVALAYNLVSGRIGRAMRAIRDDDLAAMTMGVYRARVKTMTFAVSAAFAGVSGVMYTWVLGFITPESFTFLRSIEFLAAVIIGGLGTLAGSIIGAFVLVWLPIFAQDIHSAAPGMGFGALIVIIMIVAPSGIMGLLRRIWNRFVRMTPPPVQGTGEARSTERPTAPVSGGVVGEETDVSARASAEDDHTKGR